MTNGHVWNVTKWANLVIKYEIPRMYYKLSGSGDHTVPFINAFTLYGFPSSLDQQNNYFVIFLSTDARFTPKLNFLIY